MSKVLIVDDEKMIVKGLSFSLQADGIECDAAYDGEEAVALAKAGAYDVILLDIMLPKLDGYEVCRQVRAFSDVPIIMLTAKGEDTDKILGLNTGADDYMTKPFNVLEVKARIAAILRRTGRREEKPAEAPAKPQTAPAARRGRKKNAVVTAGDLSLDTDKGRAYLRGEAVALTGREYEVLELLMLNPGKIYSRDSIRTLVWGKDYPGDARTVDVHVRRLREKIEPDPGSPTYVHTKWGVGYYFEV